MRKDGDDGKFSKYLPGLLAFGGTLVLFLAGIYVTLTVRVLDIHRRDIDRNSEQIRECGQKLVEEIRKLEQADVVAKSRLDAREIDASAMREDNKKLKEEIQALKLRFGQIRPGPAHRPVPAR